MPLSPQEARVLACLVEKAATVPDAYPLTLNALRLACNQSSNRHPVVAYDDRTVEQALMALKSIGLVRFVHPSHGGRTIRYRHVADERWRLERNELAVLAMLALRGPQTVAELRARTERLVDEDAGGPSIDDALDTLAARTPEPFATRLERHAGEREARWAHLLGGEIDEAAMAPPDGTGSVARPATSATADPATLTAVAAEVAHLRRRLDRLEELLGVDPIEG
ncbi:MAG: YceH family protein [Desertimonas sp.]